MAEHENSYACYWINNIKYPLKTPYPNNNSRTTSIYVLQDSSSKYRIYIAGYFDNGSNNEACYWADFGANLITLPVDNITLDSFAYSIFIYGDKIYTGGEYNNNPCYWGNNNLESIPPIVCNKQSHIFVTPNGDTHLVVYSGGPSCVYFKNGKLKYTILDREVYSIYVFNDDVYIAGTANIGAGWHASYWKNEDDDTIFVDDENIGSRIYSIFVIEEYK